jgi:hypothetical protein
MEVDMKVVKWLVKAASGKSGCWVSNVLTQLGGCKGSSDCSPAGPAGTSKGSQDWISRLMGMRGNSMAAQNAQATTLLDEVMAKLGSAVEARLDGATAGGGNQLLDAIDRELAAEPRQTAVTKLGQSEVVEQFRHELETQSLTVTTVTSFLQILQQVLPLLLVK